VLHATETLRLIDAPGCTSSAEGAPRPLVRGGPSLRRRFAGLMFAPIGEQDAAWIDKQRRERH